MACFVKNKGEAQVLINPCANRRENSSANYKAFPMTFAGVACSERSTGVSAGVRDDLVFVTVAWRLTSLYVDLHAWVGLVLLVLGLLKDDFIKMNGSPLPNSNKIGVMMARRKYQ